MARSNVQSIRTPVSVGRMTDAELLLYIRSLLSLTIENIEKLGVAMREARRRNLSMAEFSSGLPSRLIQVAEEKLDAEILVKFCDHAALLDAVKGVPLNEQRKLAQGATVDVVELDRSTGDFITRAKTLRQLTGPQARLVFADGRKVSPADQRAQLKKLANAAKPAAAKESATPKRVSVKPDLETGEIIVGVYRLEARKFLPALKALGLI